jgi:H/ACA ribonucleoprotein complex subunit 3
MRLHRCTVCGRYTLKEACSECRGKTRIPRPPKYSPEDKYGRYRRLLKEEA